MTSIRPDKKTVAEHLSGSGDSWHGTIGDGTDFPPESDRYHLYIGLFCPFAHRANLVRHLKGLQDVIHISVVKAYPKGDENGWPGWQFPKDDREYPDATVDHLFGYEYMHQVYFRDDPEYKGRYSVPVLWDKKKSVLVNNESTDLLRNLQTAFNSLLSPEKAALSFYPEERRAEIDQVCTWMQRDLNTGVYKAGFANSQEEYDKNVIPVFAALNRVEKLLAKSGGPYVLGTDLTEVDLRLYPTAIRFDPAYVQHFKCNLGTIRHDYPMINNWMKNLYWNVEGFRETTNFKHIKENYTRSHAAINPKAITPMGPYPDIEEGFEQDFARIRVGGVALQAVIEQEKLLP